MSKSISKAVASKKAAPSPKAVPSKKAVAAINAKKLPETKVPKAKKPEIPVVEIVKAPVKKAAKKKSEAAVAAPAKVAKKAEKTPLPKKTAAPKGTAIVKEAPKQIKLAATPIAEASKPAEAAPKSEPEINKSPIYRYSDEELNEFKELIMNRLEVGRKELLYMQAQMLGRDGTGAEDNADRRLSIEDGSGAMDREQLSLLASRQLLFINNLEKALIRIMNKTYGICRETGKLIDKARLRAVPHATLSMEAKTKGKK